MFCHRSCNKSSHGNGMGNIQSMASMDRLCDGKAIWYHQPRSAIWSHLLIPHPTPSPLHWWTRSSYWTLICFRSLALFFYLYDILLPKQWHFACSTCLQILIFPTPSAGVKGEPEERNEKIHIRTELPLKKKKKKPTRKKFDSFLISVRNKRASNKGEKSQLLKTPLSGIWQ